LNTDDIDKGMRIMTGAGPGTVIRVCEDEVHVRPDKHHSLTCVYRPADISGPITQEQLDYWQAVQRKTPHRATETP
jgi:hypothetical protein